MYYDYRLRLQVQLGTPQEIALKFLKNLSEDSQFDEKQRTVLALCSYWMVEALSHHGTSKETIQQMATASLLELSFQMQKTAELAGIDLEDLDIPEPVLRLATNTHQGVREAFVSALVSGGDATFKKTLKPKRSSAKKTSKPKSARKPEVLVEEEEVKEVIPAPRKQVPAKTNANGSGFSTKLFG